MVIRTNGSSTNLRVFYRNEKYGLSEPTQFFSIPGLVDYYSQVPLPTIGITLAYPVSKNINVCLWDY